MRHLQIYYLCAVSPKLPNKKSQTLQYYELWDYAISNVKHHNTPSNEENRKFQRNLLCCNVQTFGVILKVT